MSSASSAIKNVLNLIKEKDVQYVDLRFTDMRGKWHHTSQHVSTIDEDSLKEGFFFDGSSIAGWQAINESDMILAPDCDNVQMDPFTAMPTLVINCDVIDPKTNKPYLRCPRSIAKKAEAFLANSGVADTAYFGPEAEFFVFDNVQFDLKPNNIYYKVESEEGAYSSGREFPNGNMGHRPVTKGGYFPVPPVDSGQDYRSEMVSLIQQMGVTVEKHHHEVASAQHELGIKFSNLLAMADGMQIYKYVVHNVAHSYGKSATFMPKPIFGDNGSGMHVHQSLWKGGKPLFAGDGYAGLSDMALHYIGGVIAHARAINAFTNSTTNSYKRLVPGFEAPILLAYSSRNRSASCRIPHASGPKGKRVEFRFPDPASCPHLAFAAMLMAGLDGIKHKIHPGEAMEKNLYALPPEELAQIPTVCRTLSEALEALADDHEFLLQGNVFSAEFIGAYIDLKMEDVTAFDISPHPIEYKMYYSV